MIRRIVLENFMSHPATVIEPAPGVTVLTGPNNCGKSAVVEALRCLIDNESGRWFIRHGTEGSRVTLEFTDEGKDHTILWSKSRKSGGWYRINGNDHPRQQGGTPDGFDLVHRMRQEEGQDVHLSKQKFPMFLLDSPPATVAKFFSTASDVNLLLKMNQELAAEKRVRNTRRGEVGILLEAADRALDRLAPVPELEVRLQEATRVHNSLLEAQAKSRELRAKLPALEDLEIACERQLAVSGCLESLQAPPLLPPLEQMATHVRAWQRALFERKRAEARQRAALPLQPLPAFQNSSDLADRLTQLKRGERAVARGRARRASYNRLITPPSLHETSDLNLLLRQANAIGEQVITAQTRTRELAAEMTQVEVQLRAALATHPTCPLCGSLLTAEHLLGGTHA